MSKLTKNNWKSPDYKQSTNVEIDYKKARNNHCLITNKPGPELDTIKILRTRLLYNMRLKDWRTVMVTSVQPGEGKTVTAINLSFAMAREHQHTVVLVDCDFRRPRIGRYLGIKSDVGLSDYFQNNKSLDEMIVWPGVEKISLILGHRSLVDSSEISGSPKMKALVTELKQTYDHRYIFFDVPPLLTGSDAIAFVPNVDGVLIVVEAGRTSAKEIKRAQALVPADKLLGFVLNKDSSSNSNKYYYY